MKRALVFYLYGNRNAGDMAICLGAIELLKKQNYEISMVSRFSAAEEEYWRSKEYLSEYYPNVKVYPGPFSFERDYSAMKKIFAYMTSLLRVIGIIPDKQILQLINEADVVLFNGGNLLRGANAADYLRLIALFYPIKIAHSIGKPVCCLPQSSAQISCCGEKILRKYLRCFDAVYVREEISFKKLQNCFPDIAFTQATDLAFLCANTDTAARKFFGMGINLPLRTVAIIVRNTGIGDIGELDEDKQKRMKTKLFDFINAHPDFHYLIVVQTEKDRCYSQRILTEIQQMVNAELVENHDPLVLREIYKNVDAVVTMRLHAGILALSALTPVVGLFSETWGLKNQGIMKEYKMPYLMIENTEEGVLTLQNSPSKVEIQQMIQEKVAKINVFGG